MSKSQHDDVDGSSVRETPAAITKSHPLFAETFKRLTPHLDKDDCKSIVQDELVQEHGISAEEARDLTEAAFEKWVTVYTGD